MDKEKLEGVPPGNKHLDTVRSLHQTVVSLRTALEVSKNELKELKEKYEEHSRCLDYSDIIEKLTLENHILRRRIIDSNDRDSKQNIKLEVLYSPKIESCNTIKEDRNTSDENDIKVDTADNKKSEDPNVKFRDHFEFDTKFNTPDNTSRLNDSDIGHGDDSRQKNDKSNFKTKLELLSKFDVKIKVKTAKDGSESSSTTDATDTDINSNKQNPSENINLKERIEHFEELKSSKGDKINLKSVSTENIKMAVPNEAEVKSKTDKFDVQVRITSEDNLIVQQNIERGKNKDTLNLDIDNLSLRSMSEGDNSVFSEGVVTPIDPHPVADDKQDQENASGNESEEVDDIELIFTTDESKDMSNLQEDLVSIRETDQWTPASASTAHSTPVLIKFHTLDPDFQPAEDHTRTKPQTSARESIRMKRVSLPNDKDFKQGFNGKGSLDLPGRGILKSTGNSDNMLYRRSPNTSTRRLDSVDSLTCDFNRGLSLDHTKSSNFELGSSLDVLHRDESIDSFYKTKLGHRFSIFAETDISKCGISEDDLASNLNIRRNTCPNPFQYRPVLHRGLARTGFKTSNRPRPVLYQGFAPRRESAAQTDVSALPPRWTSDGYLAYKIPEIIPPVPVPRVSRAPVINTRTPVPRPDEARRVLLSDIGFTSMVPELSRSAEPLWSRLQQVQDSPLPRYISRGSSHRSPTYSNDRSNDWTTHAAAHTIQEYRPWRGSLPDVRNDDTEELLQEAETYLRRSIDSLRSTSLDRSEEPSEKLGQPYIPSEARQLRLGHTVKLITPQGRLVVGKVRYVGLAGSSVVVGAECGRGAGGGAGAGPRNDGTHRGRRYFRAAPHHSAVFVPFSKVVMAWAN